MRIVGKINRTKGKKAEFTPIDVFPEDTRYFKKIKNKKIEIENKSFKKGEIIVLSKDFSHKLLYKNIRKKKNLVFVPERGKYYGVLENGYIKVMIDPEKGGMVNFLLDKTKNFEWFFDDFVYIQGRSARCGISQGISGKNVYEKKIDYKITKESFRGRRKEKDFIFKKFIKLNKNKIIFSFELIPKKDKEFYPFFEVKIFTGGKIYKYFLKIKKDKKIIEIPHKEYPFWGIRFDEEFGTIDEVRYLNEKKKLIFKPLRKNFLNYSFHYGLNYFLNRFYYKKINVKKGRRIKIKMEIRV